MQIEVSGKTLKGKNRIREHGSLWEVEKVDTDMFLVRPVGSKNQRNIRWIMKTNDLNFKVEAIHEDA